MINKSTKQLKRYCVEPLDHIENYDRAISDKDVQWDCHHRCEVLPCGVFSVQDLKNFGLYWHRPASELVFLRHTDHIGIHAKNRSKDARMKMSKANKGKCLSDETRRKISEAKLGRKLPPFSDEHRRKLSENKKRYYMERRSKMK